MSHPSGLVGPRWRKSSYSQPTQSDCVELATLGETVAVRDSKAPEEACLYFDANTWRALVTNVKAFQPEA